MRTEGRSALQAVLGGAAVLALAACGPGAQGSVLAQAAQGLSSIRSGDMDLRMAVSAGDGSGQVGFEEKGPFSLPNVGALPVAQTDVVRFVGDKQESSSFISTGRSVFIGSGGQVYRLPDATVARLRQASGGGGNLAGLQIDRWAKGASVMDGGTVDGVSTDRVVASVSVPQFLNDVMQLSRGLGQNTVVPQITTADAADLSRAVKASHFEAWVGRDDHLVRRLSVGVDFSAPAGGPNSDAVARYSQSRIQLDLLLSRVNHPVTVAEPPGAQPFAAFCSRQPDAPACAAATAS